MAAFCPLVPMLYAHYRRRNEKTRSTLLWSLLTVAFRTVALYIVPRKLGLGFDEDGFDYSDHTVLYLGQLVPLGWVGLRGEGGGLGGREGKGKRKDTTLER